MALGGYWLRADDDDVNRRLEVEPLELVKNLVIRATNDDASPLHTHRAFGRGRDRENVYLRLVAGDAENATNGVVKHLMVARSEVSLELDVVLRHAITVSADCRSVNLDQDRPRSVIISNIQPARAE